MGAYIGWDCKGMGWDGKELGLAHKLSAGLL